YWLPIKAIIIMYPRFCLPEEIGMRIGDFEIVDRGCAIFKLKRFDAQEAGGVVFLGRHQQ
ncbi:MAG: hypothetical protein P8Y67_12225, partial [Alphaproteobacteria bacterium]